MGIFMIVTEIIEVLRCAFMNDNAFICFCGSYLETQNILMILLLLNKANASNNDVGYLHQFCHLPMCIGTQIYFSTTSILIS